MGSILILGAGVMQGPAMRIARRKGLRVYAADADSGAACAGEADVFLPIDLKDKEALAEAAAGIGDLRGVFTAGTDFSASVAWVAERLGLPGIPYEAALDASDKARMRAVLARAGVPVPAFAAGGEGDDPERLAESVAPLPLVVKPVDSMGARGCRLARTPAELREAWADAMAFSRTRRAIIEAYLEGPEFSLDAVVSNGRVAVRGIADRFVTFEPYFVEMGHTMPTSYGPEVVKAVTDTFLAGIAALGIRDGAAKGDIKYTRDGPFVGEIAARLSGGYMSGWTYPYASGIEATAEAIDIACGLTPGFAEPSLSLACAERAWISMPGRVASVTGLEAARARAGVRDVFPRAAPGQRVVFPCNNVQKCGNVLAVAATQVEADAVAEAAARDVLVRLEPGDRESEAFLARGPAWAWVPDAFPGLSAMTLASLAKLPDMLRIPEPGTSGPGTSGPGESMPGNAGPSIGIAPLRGLETEASRDWQGRSPAEALAAVESLCGARVGLEADIVLGAAFWRAFLRGGYQGGVLAVESALGYRV